MKKIFLLSIIFLSIQFIFAQSENAQMQIHTATGVDQYDLVDIDSITFLIPSEAGTVTDIDGNVYQTVKIGDQIWMKENLRVTHFRSGEGIPNVTDAAEWDSMTTSAYCVYNNEESNKNIYGLLYNWYAAKDDRNVAPEGWHVATDEDWKQLEMYLGMTQSEADKAGSDRGTDQGGKLKETGTTHWLSPNTGATDEINFSALPAGYRYHAPSADYERLFQFAYFWSNSDDNYARFRSLSYEKSTIYRAEFISSNKPDGMSIRCVKDQ